MLKFLRHLRPYLWPIILVVVLTFFQVMANLQLPRLMAQIVDDGILQGDQSAVYKVGFWMILVTLGGTVAAAAAGYVTALVSSKLARDVRRKLFTKIESLSLREFKIFSTASLITRTTNDIEQVQRVTVMMLRMMLIAPLMAIGALINAVQTAPSLTWIIVVSVVLLSILVAGLFSMTVPKFKLLQQLVDKLNQVTRESLTGIRVVRAFNKEKTQEAKFDVVNQELKGMNLFVSRWMITMEPVMTLVMSLAMIAVVWFGAHLVNVGQLEVGNMMAFMQYTTRSIMAFLQISMIFIMLPRASVSAARIDEVLALESSIKSPEKPHKPGKKPAGKIEFKNVSFGYPDADELVLSDICFTAEPGQTTAIIGSTGSGKTALVDLIPRLYDATGGQVLFDGIDLKKWDLKDLSKHIGYVPQKARLFSGSVAENVSYGKKDASDEQIQKALKIAQASDFVSKLPEGIESDIAQGGDNVSGGQKQRLSIARALAIEPSVLIFDDSLSALDFKTDAKLRQALKKAENITQIIVGQRISNIMNSDKIVVLDKGRVVGQGTHTELSKTNKVYQEMVRSQMSDREVAHE